MLVFFPAFSVVFGGAQLAGILIIQNASGPNGAIMHVLGMLVQIIPLAITPLIMKFSGGVLGKFAGFVNDKNKGGTTGLKTGLKVVVRSLETRSWLILIWRDSTQIVYVVGHIITVYYSKKIWKLHRKMPKIHLEKQPGIRS